MNYTDREQWVNKIHHGNALDILKRMPSEFVDTIITSPPYWRQRNYESHPEIWGGNINCEHKWSELVSQVQPSTKKIKGTGYIAVSSTCNVCGAYKGELGQEPTSEKFVENLASIFIEAKRVLKKHGSLFINIDDSYKDKSLCLIPEKLALKLIDAGYILRNKIIWHKKNAIPESVRDRFTTSWEYLYFFTKSDDYYFEQLIEPIIQNDEISGRNMRDVWTVNTTGLRDTEHYATFPQKLIVRPIDACCPAEICSICNQPRRKITKSEYKGNSLKNGANYANGGVYNIPSRYTKKEFLGYSDCDCKEKKYLPGIVLDPFFGTGTTGLVAKKRGRSFIGIEINQKFISIANKRIYSDLGLFV